MKKTLVDDRPLNDLMNDGTLSPSLELTEEDTSDCDHGREAGLTGKPNDDTKSQEWQRGWGDAEKERKGPSRAI